MMDEEQDSQALVLIFYPTMVDVMVMGIYLFKINLLDSAMMVFNHTLDTPCILENKIYGCIISRIIATRLYAWSWHIKTHLYV